MTEEVMLEDIHNRAKLLLKAVSKYLMYKIWKVNDETTTCGELARETENQKKLFDVLNEYLEKEQIKQDLFKLLHEEAARLNKENDHDD